MEKKNIVYLKSQTFAFFSEDLLMSFNGRHLRL